MYVLLQVRIILNKSDQVDQQQLMRVYGALMWSLGKVFKSPEVCKVRSHCCWCWLACSLAVLHVWAWPWTSLLQWSFWLQHSNQQVWLVGRSGPA
jgi:hypothetical protein